jgi:hypothetical protein
MVMFIIRDRRRRNAPLSESLTQIKDTVVTAPPPRPSRNAIPPLFSAPTNPLYTKYNYATEKTKDSMQDAPPPPASAASPFRFALDLSRPHPPSLAIPSSVNSPNGNASFTSVDIENILNSATFLQDRPSPLDHRYRPSDISLPRSVHLAVPNDSGSMRPSRRTHQRDPSDVPAEAGRGGSLQVPHGVGPERFSFWSGLSEGGGGSLLAPRNSVVSEEIDPSWYGVAQ